jgi:hypothetical protein
MPRRPRSTKTSDRSAPKPPSRQEFERQMPEVPPHSSQRLLTHTPQRISDREALDQLDSKAGTEREIPATQSIVVMTCAVNKTSFAVKFERYRLLRWHVTDTFLLGRAKGTPNGKMESVPVNQMDFSKAVCPSCGARCRPIFCGGCEEFVCDGGVTILPSSESFHRCVCGAMGTLTPTLKAVSAANAAESREPGGARSSSPASPLLLRFRTE